VICILFTGHPVRRVFFMQKQFQKVNYAVWMYEKVGFRTVDENYEEFIMECEL
jgi:hypothetical protein